MFLLKIAIVLPGLNAFGNVTSHNRLLFHPKLSDLVLLVVPNAYDTPIQRYLRFVQWRHICNERKERDTICLCKDENAQLHSAGRMGKLAPIDCANG